MQDLKDELLDDKDPNLTYNKQIEFIAWWERGRVFYNLALFTAYAIAFFSNWANVVRMTWFELGVGLLLFYTLIANVFYTMGWAIELLRTYYFKNDSQFLIRYKLWFWFVGTVLSGVWVYHIISNNLEHWSPTVYFQF